MVVFFRRLINEKCSRLNLDDELKPISATYTDSLAELGNAKRRPDDGYEGVALTLIDALDTLAVMGNKTEFTKMVKCVVLQSAVPRPRVFEKHGFADVH